MQYILYFYFLKTIFISFAIHFIFSFPKFHDLRNVFVLTSYFHFHEMKRLKMHFIRPIFNYHFKTYFVNITIKYFSNNNNKLNILLLVKNINRNFIVYILNIINFSILFLNINTFFDCCS